MTPITALNLQRKIEEVLSNFEPRAKITQILADPDIDRNGYKLEIKEKNLPHTLINQKLLRSIA